MANGHWPPQTARVRNTSASGLDTNFPQTPTSQNSFFLKLFSQLRIDESQDVKDPILPLDFSKEGYNLHCLVENLSVLFGHLLSN